LEFRILGPLEVSDGDRLLRLSGPKQGALLALLLLHANEVVSSDRLIDELWGEEPPQTGANALQARVSQLRRALGRSGSEALVTRAPGYLLEVGPGELDAERFVRLAGVGRQALAQGDAVGAAATLGAALALWRGPALADFAYEPFAQGEIARLAEARLTALEERLEADLALGRHGELVGELEALVTAHPLRERLRGQLMLALYRSGRQAEALEAYQETRRILVEELGIEPSPPLRELHAAILNQEPALALGAPLPVGLPAQTAPEPSLPPAAEAFASARETRKTITVLASDFTDSASPKSLDPEVLHRVGRRFSETVSPVIERHGGTLDRPSRSRVLGLFGVPAMHEDDALRAVRAAVELDEALVRFNDELESELGVRVAVSTGIATGEVLTGSRTAEPPLVIGDALDRAVGLRGAAGRGEVLVDEATRRLVRDAVRVEPADTPAQEAASGTAFAWRLLELVPGAPPFARHFDAPLVGRERELAQLRQAFERTARERVLQLFTVLGAAGIGKSRLVQELVSIVGGDAIVLSGRCLSYGEGITFWPLREIVRHLGGEEPREALSEILRADAEAELVAERIAGVLGLGEVSGEETFWAFRRLFEALARERPLVLVFEDIHWAEPTLLDLIEYLADLTREAPVLLLCLARPELLDDRPSWGGGKPNAASILLEPLVESESEALIDNLGGLTGLDQSARGRILEAAEGNPLYVEQMLALLAEEGVSDESLPLPPSIQALLSARLDRLGPGERAVIERAAVVGREFWRGAVVDLLPDEARASAARHFDALVRKELTRPCRSAFPGEEAFRFRHALIQNAAYRTIPKAHRGEFHEGFAAWLERKAGTEIVEYEEILGYHLEQAFRYRAELGRMDDHARELASRAAERLAAGGRRAFHLGDIPAAANLLDRATTLLPADDRARAELLPDLGFALFELGELERADDVLADAVDRARALSDRRLEWHAVVLRAHRRLYWAAGELVEELREQIKPAIAVFEELGDHLGLTRAWSLLSDVHWATGQGEKGVQAAERGAEHARRAGRYRDESFALNLLGWGLVFGPTPVGEAIARLQVLLERGGASRAPASRATEADILHYLGMCHAMLGRFDDAREQVIRTERMVRDLDLNWKMGWVILVKIQIELLAGDAAAAERHLRAAQRAAGETRDRWLSWAATPRLAHVLYDQGRYEEALEVTGVLDEVSATPDVAHHGRLLSVRAKLLARKGRVGEAEAMAREAVALVEPTDLLPARGDVLMDLAEVLRLAGRPEDAIVPLRAAQRLYEQKGDIVSAGKACALLADLESATRLGTRS